jgi:ribonuclease HII
MGILPANAQAMRRALAQLNPAGHFLLIDGRERLRGVCLPQETLVRGDSLSLSVAAASILAKVTRDRLMCSLAERFPVYGFGRHKGYCTRTHQAALQAHGPCPEHRQTFAPIQDKHPLLP